MEDLFTWILSSSLFLWSTILLKSMYYFTSSNKITHQTLGFFDVRFPLFNALMNVQFFKKAITKFKKTWQNIPIFKSLTTLHQMVSFQFALYFVSISYKVPCSAFWKVLDGMKYFFSEGFVYPNAEQEGILDISTYKCSNNLILVFLLSKS